MSKITGIKLFLSLALAQAPAWSGGIRAQVPILNIIGEAAKKAIMAIDLHVQQLQNETLALQKAQKDLENEMHLEELTAISGWLEQQKELYAGYYQELKNVKTVISDFQKVADMLQKQGLIATQFKQMQSVISQDHHFSAAEVSTMTNTLTAIVDESARNISQLELAIQRLVTQMHDADRLRIIDEAGSGIDKNYSDLQEFYQRSLLLSLERAQSQNDVTATKALYGL